MSWDELAKIATAWMDEDPDPQTRAATAELLASGDLDALRDHFGQRLTFGTAGLRGALGPGPNRMNRAGVRRVTAGLAAWLREHHPDAPSVVIGFDARQGSREFADDAAGVLSAAGIDVHLFDEVVPTPELAFAVLHLQCDAGIMVTASHNPPGDNGYKVYAGNGAQIVPPTDTQISAAIDTIRTTPAAGDRSRVRPVPPEVGEAWVQQIHGLRVHRETGARIVYTAMHGVGTPRVLQVLREAGHTEVHPVPEQCTPDGSFPTVAFPNPEEPGALDLAIRLAEEVGADVILANDPDADRLAVAIPDAQGTWRQLTGNQVGCLMAEDLLSHGTYREPRLVACSIVSSTLLRHIAAHHGARHQETLTGFKWIANGAAIPHEATGGSFVMGFEEALGYSAGSVVRDKDGVSAALLLADLVAWSKSRGETLWDRLDTLYRRHGLFASAQHSLVLPGAAGQRRIASLLDQLRKSPPTSLAGAAVVRITDIQAGRTRDLQTGTEAPVELPTSNVLVFELADGGRVLARPSGTEPKMKFYLEIREAMQDQESLAAAESRAEAHLQTLKADLFEHLGLS